MSEKYRIELRNRQCATDETLQSLHGDIKRLAALAYKGVPPEMRDQVTCDSFLDALGDPELAFKIRERQPTDLDSALRIALQLEVWAKEMNRHRETSRPERTEGRRLREIDRKDEFNKNQDTITRTRRNTPDMPVEHPETKLLEHMQVVTDHQQWLGMPHQMLTVGQWRRPVHEDSIQQIMAEQR